MLGGEGTRLCTLPKMSSPRRKTVAFHVGAHKTGTSVVQSYLRDNARRLRRHRLVYLHRSAMNGFVGWGDKLVEDPALLARRIEQVLRIPWFNIVVASHENTLGRPFVGDAPGLYPRAPEIIPALHRVLQPYRAKVFFSIRPQVEFVESYYLQLIHQGGHQPFQDWLATIDLDALSWQPTVRALTDAFGPEQVEILDFRQVQRDQQAYLRDFFRRIDPRLSVNVDLPAVRNPSISDKGLRLALAANPHLTSHAERRLMRVFLQDNFSNVDYPRPVLLTDEQRAHLEGRYGAEYQALVS